MNYYYKYQKYKKKYLQIQQHGGNLDGFKENFYVIFSNSRMIINPINTIINKCYKSTDDFFYFCSVFLNNNNKFLLETLTEAKKKEIKDNLKSKDIDITDLTDNKDYTIIVDTLTQKLNMYDRNLFITMFDGIDHNETNDRHFIEKTSKYLHDIIFNYKDGSFINSTIYLGIAVCTQEGFYIPQFIKEKLEDNPELKYTIIIIANEYKETFEGACRIDTNKIIEKFKFDNEELAHRILFIHVMMTIPNNILPNIEIEFLNKIATNDNINYCYLGYSECGKLFYSHRVLPEYHQKKHTTNIIFVGCDGLFYGEKKIEFPEVKLTIDNSAINELLLL
jgi:hypothetical protein